MTPDGPIEARAAARAEKLSAATLSRMESHRLRVARLLARWALWRTGGHPKALTAAATIWLASGRYRQALRYAERAEDSLRLGLCEMDDSALEALSGEVATTGTLACCHLRNQTQDLGQRDLLANDAIHWFKLLAETNIELAGYVAAHPVLRDLRPIMEAELEQKNEGQA